MKSSGFILAKIEEEAKKSGLQTPSIGNIFVATLRAVQSETDSDLSDRINYWRSTSSSFGEHVIETADGQVFTAEILLAQLKKSRFSSAATLELESQLREKSVLEPDQVGAEPDVPGATSTSVEKFTELIADTRTPLDELDAMIGLESTKAQIKTALATHLVNAERKKLGLQQVVNGLNFVFMGSPGTGKTTVARVIARVFREAGLLNTGDFVEASKSDLVGQYVGHTQEKTLFLLKEATGGMLFVDEAYSLVTPGAGGFGEEALTEILQYMENHRSEISIVLAGYEEDMKLLLERNAGLRSRFNVFIRFPDYSKSELLEIFKQMATSHGISVPIEVEESLGRYLASANTGGDAGNGRFVRNLFEKMNERMSARALEDGIIEEHELTSFYPEDVPSVEDSLNSASRPIGFRV